MRVYHVTSSKDAQAIAARGFRDREGQFLTDGGHTGVVVFDRPLWKERGIELEHLACFEIELDGQELVGCELIDIGKPYREWLVAASILNAGAVARLLTAAEFKDLIDA